MCFHKSQLLSPLVSHASWPPVFQKWTMYIPIPTGFQPRFAASFVCPPAICRPALRKKSRTLESARTKSARRNLKAIPPASTSPIFSGIAAKTEHLWRTLTWMLHCLVAWRRLRKRENVSHTLYRDKDTVRDILSCSFYEDVLIMLFGFFVFSDIFPPCVLSAFPFFCTISFLSSSLSLS